MKTKVIALSLLFVLTLAPSSYATLPVIDYSAIAQAVASYIRQAQQLYQEVQYVQNQLVQLSNEAKNLENMNGSAAAAVTTAITGNLQTLQNINSSSQAMTFNYGNLQASFGQAYPGFQAYNGMTAQQYAQQMTTIQNQTHQAMYDSMKAQGLADPNKVQSEGQLIQNLINASQTTTGALSAAQTGSQIAGFQAQQMLEQKQIMATAYRAEASYQEQQLQQQQAQQAAINQMIQPQTSTTPTKADILNGK